MTPEDIERILSWPNETRSGAEIQRLVEYRALIHREMWDLVAGAERQGRSFTAEEQAQFDRLSGEFDRLACEVPSR